MNSAAQDLLEHALKLPAPERADLAAQLLASLETEQDDDVRSAWEEEIRRRAAQVDQQIVQLIPRDEAMRRIRGS